MENSYVLVVAIVTYCLGAFTKLIWKTLPHKWIPMQNVLIALISACFCYLTKIETNFLTSIVLCFSATLGAGGFHDLLKILKENSSS